MKRKIAIIWTILGCIYAIGLAISLYFSITALMENQLNQKLIEVIGIPALCIGVCILLTFAFVNTIENYKKDAQTDENDQYKIEELGAFSRKNGQIIFGFLGFVLFLAIVGIIVFIILAVNKAIWLWLGILGPILCLVISAICIIGILYYKALYSHDDYHVGLIYLRSLKK
jgi:hypothetical protein